MATPLAWCSPDRGHALLRLSTLVSSTVPDGRGCQCSVTCQQKGDEPSKCLLLFLILPLELGVWLSLGLAALCTPVVLMTKENMNCAVASFKSWRWPSRVNRVAHSCQIPSKGTGWTPSRARWNRGDKEMPPVIVLSASERKQATWWLRVLLSTLT